MPLHHATLRQLKVFEAAARHQSFSRAADELHLTQPGVSMQVKELEDHAGLPLFERIGRKMHITEAGRELLARHARNTARAQGRPGCPRRAPGPRSRAPEPGRHQHGQVLRAAIAGAFSRAASGARVPARREQPRGRDRAARRQRGGPGHHGAPAGGACHRRRIVRAASVRDHRGAGSSVGGPAPDRRVETGGGDVSRARARLRHAVGNAAVRRGARTRTSVWAWK